MKIVLNGEPREIAGTTLSDALDECGFGAAKVATALNGDFVPGPLRAGAVLTDGDRVEVVAPMQGG